MHRILKLFINFLEKVEVILSNICLFLIIFLTSLQVFFRYILRAPFSWTLELSLVIFEWLIFLGISLVFKKNRHISIDFFTNKFIPERYNVYLNIFGNFCTTLLMIILFIATLKLLPKQFKYHTIALEIPKAYVSMSIIYFAFSVFLTSLNFLIRDFKSILNKKVKQDDVYNGVNDV